MFGSTTHTIRRLAGLAVAAGAFAALIPVAQAGSGFQGEHDATDPVSQPLQAQQSPTFDGREYARPTFSSPSPSPSPDVVERAVRARELSAISDLSGMPDVFERTVAAGQLQYTSQPTTTNRFDWNDFGIGAGAGIGLMLLLLGIAAGVWTMRQEQRQVSSI
jgi:hypothetical protein